MQQGSVWKQCSEHGRTGIGGVKACKKAHGSWYFAANGRRGPDGRRRQVSEGGYRTQEDARAALTEHLEALAAGRAVVDRQRRVGAWLTEWLAECDARVVAGTLEASTCVEYGRHVAVMVPLIGHHRLIDLTAGHVDAMVVDLCAPQSAERVGPGPAKVPCSAVAAAGTPCRNWAVRGGTVCRRHGGVPEPVPDRPSGNRGRLVERRSGSTVDGYRRTLRAALSAAQRRDLVMRNVAEGRMPSMPRRSRPDTTIWEPEQTAAFLVRVAGEPDAAMWDLALLDGMRRGEIGGLSWSDVDLDGPLPGVWIGQTLSGAAGWHDCFVCGDQHRARRLKPRPKSDRSMRWAPLLPTTVERLRAVRAERDRQVEEWGDAWSEHGLVFCDPSGIPIRPGAFSARFDELAEDAGLPHIRLHDSRHGVASLMKAAGVPRPTIAQMLGHSEEVSERVYTHQLRGETLRALESAMKLLSPAG